MVNFKTFRNLAFKLEKKQFVLSRMKRKTDKATIFSQNLSLHALCNLRLTDRTWAEFKNIVTQNPPGLTKL